MAVQQAVYETARGFKIAYATANTAEPTPLPNTGTSIDWTATATGEVAFGWTVAGGIDDSTLARLSDEDWTFEYQETDEQPTSPMFHTGNPFDYHHSKSDEITAIEIPMDEMGEKIAALATNITTASGVRTRTRVHTKIAIVIEIEGFGIWYMPNCQVKIGTLSGGAKAVMREGLRFQPCAGTSLASGIQFTQYQDA
jgi:hypothetical protein